ncbi:MAG TPA: hypothetical protein VIY72_00225 [Acidimicrobiales bacterium]
MTPADDLDLRDALRQALERIDALECEVRDLRRPTSATPTSAPEPTDATTPAPQELNRRHLLGKAGVAAVGAVLGGTVAAVGAASPAAAASGTFDSNSSTAAVDAVNTGGGPAVKASGTGGSGPAVTVTGSPSFAGVSVDVPDTGIGILTHAKHFGVFAKADSIGAMPVVGQTMDGIFGVLGRADGAGPHGGIGTAGYSVQGVGVYAWGKKASLLLGPGQNGEHGETPSPRTSGVAHERGELAFDAASDLWLCVANGTPGTWVRVAGPGTAGPFTVLPAPARVYDTRPNSGLPGAGTGPVTGTRNDIDLTAAASGVPVDATAAVVVLTVTGTGANAAGRAMVYSNALPAAPTVNVLRWTTANQTLAATTTTALANGKVAVRVDPHANVIVDVLGYHR